MNIDTKVVASYGEQEGAKIGNNLRKMGKDDAIHCLSCGWDAEMANFYTQRE